LVSDDSIGSAAAGAAGAGDGLKAAVCSVIAVAGADWVNQSSEESRAAARTQHGQPDALRISNQQADHAPIERTTTRDNGASARQGY